METDQMTASEASDLLDIVKLKNELSEAEKQDDRSVSDRKWERKNGGFF